MRLPLAMVAAVLVAAVFMGTVASAQEGASVVAHQESDGLHIDIAANYTGSGAGSYEPNYGIGTLRVTLPGVSGVEPPRFDTNATDPPGYTCKVVTGAYGVADTGYECSTRGQTIGVNALQFPTQVTIHLVASSCYVFPAASSAQPALADIWAAPDETDNPPDATYRLFTDSPCSVQPSAPPQQQVAGKRTAAKTCTVPNLSKLTLSKAKAKLKRAGCATGKIKRAASLRVKKGLVLAQSPKAKRKVRRGTAIGLTLSTGPQKKH